MPEQDPIDTILSDLDHDLGNCLTMLRICVQLRRNSAHLLGLLHAMLADLEMKLAAILPTFPEEEEDNANEEADAS